MQLLFTALSVKQNTAKPAGLAVFQVKTIFPSKSFRLQQRDTGLGTGFAGGLVPDAGLNLTDVDTAQRAIRAIEIETYNLEHPTPERELPPVNSLIIGVDIDRNLRREKITRRLKARLDEGMVDEIRSLINEGINPDDLIYYGLEYKFVTEYIVGNLTYNEMFSQLEIAIHQFAKRQMTWFRGMERRGFKINWIDATMPMDAKVDAILQLLKQ